MLGVRFTETMSGSYHALADAGREKRLRFTLTARGKPLSERFAADGTIDAEGLATARPVRGQLLISPIRKRTLRYELEFPGDDGRTYSFAGQKDLALLDLRRTMTTLPAKIRDESGKVIGEGVVRFDLGGDLLKFLTSFRLT